MMIVEGIEDVSMILNNKTNINQYLISNLLRKDGLYILYIFSDNLWSLQ